MKSFKIHFELNLLRGRDEVNRRVNDNRHHEGCVFDF